MDRYRVDATSLNLRSEPRVRAANRLAVLPEGHPVVRLAEGGDPAWWRIATELDGATFEGWVARRYLRPLAGAPSAADGPSRALAIPVVHLVDGHPEARRCSRVARAFPLGEPGAPGRDLASSATRTAALDAIVEWLDVARSRRYQPEGLATFCNVYAHDYAHLAGVYLPRVWWTEDALLRIACGETVHALYGRSLREMTANDLLHWLGQHGGRYGWRRLPTPAAAQEAANDGEVVVVCAERRGSGSGHVAAVVPETRGAAVRSVEGEVLRPLQSQAGAVNFARGTGARAWWADGDRFRDAGFWAHA